jgi:acyl-coenzyme A synthetase/AMP-(fatty) acid ligase
VPGTRVEALSASGEVLGPGEHGRLRVATPAMPSGYYGPDASLPGFESGWFYPGDEGYVTADGLVFVTGRTDTILNTGGHKAAPEFIESSLSQLPGVRDAAVLRIDDAVVGGRIAAILVADRTANWKVLAAQARSALGDLAPERYFRCDELPRNAMGKLERASLAGWLERSEAVTVE